MVNTAERKPDFAERTSSTEPTHFTERSHSTERSQESVSQLSLENLREDYRRAELSEENCDPNPFTQFSRWFNDAQAAHLKEPNAMSLATATSDGRPSARIVLLKEVAENGFVFYTSYTSRKGQELEHNPFCAVVFYWGELERQVRIEGRITKVDREKTERYFSGRPKGSRLGALVSNQSEKLPSRQPLVEKLLALEAEYANTDDVPTPAYWGGYCITPQTLEFWQGRPNRLHDRILYTKTAAANWKLERLSP